MPLRHAVVKRLQKVFWVYLTHDFVVDSVGDLKMSEARSGLEFLRITPENYFRVREFREEARVDEYAGKLAQGELGYFAQAVEGMVGSIWATINRSRNEVVVRGYMPLRPAEALIHDIVTGERFRGRGVGPFMVERMCAALLHDHAAAAIIIDVNVRNKPSLRMMEKAGLQAKQTVLYVSAFSRMAFKGVIHDWAKPAGQAQHLGA